MGNGNAALTTLRAEGEDHVAALKNTDHTAGCDSCPPLKGAVSWHIRWELAKVDEYQAHRQQVRDAAVKAAVGVVVKAVVGALLSALGVGGIAVLIYMLTS